MIEYFSDINEITDYIETLLLSEMPNPAKGPVKSRFELPSREECQDNEWEMAWFDYYIEYAEP